MVFFILNFLDEQSKFAFIPFLVSRIKKIKFILILKIIFVLIILLSLIYITSANITVLKNQGGYKKAIFWVIMVSISITFNYLIFLPLICLVKTKILLKYGPFHPRKFSFNIKNLLFLFFITETDRAIFKELKETIKNNNTQDQKIMTSFFGYDDDNNFLKTINSFNDENEEKENLINNKLKKNKEEIGKDNNKFYEEKINGNGNSLNVKNVNNEILNIDEIQLEDQTKKNKINEINDIVSENKNDLSKNDELINSNENKMNNSDFIFEEENPVNIDNYTKNNFSNNLDFSQVSPNNEIFSNKNKNDISSNKKENYKKEDDDINFTD